MTWQSLEREELHERRDGSAFRDPGLHPRYCLPRNALGRLSPSCPPDPPVYPLPEWRTRACVWVRSMTSTMVEIRETPFRVVIWVEHPRAGAGAAQGTGTEMMSRSADEMSPFRRAPQAEAGRRPGAYTPPTLRPPVAGQHRPSTGLVLSRIGPKPASRSPGELILAWTAGVRSHRLTGSMKRKNESQLVTVEDFYRRCLQGTKPRLGQVASKRGSRARKRRIAAGSKQATLWDRLRDG